MYGTERTHLYVDFLQVCLDRGSASRVKSMTSRRETRCRHIARYWQIDSSSKFETDGFVHICAILCLKSCWVDYDLSPRLDNPQPLKSVQAVWDWRKSIDCEVVSWQPTQQSPLQSSTSWPMVLRCMLQLMLHQPTPWTQGPMWQACQVPLRWPLRWCTLNLPTPFLSEHHRCRLCNPACTPHRHTAMVGSPWWMAWTTLRANGSPQVKLCPLVLWSPHIRRAMLPLKRPMPWLTWHVRALWSLVPRLQNPSLPRPLSPRSPRRRRAALVAEHLPDASRGVAMRQWHSKTILSQWLFWVSRSPEGANQPIVIVLLIERHRMVNTCTLLGRRAGSIIFNPFDLQLESTTLKTGVKQMLEMIQKEALLQLCLPCLWLLFRTQQKNECKIVF